MCESPQCFNIRHPERGIQTRKTGKQGGNLHCIMAFQKQEGSEWGVNGNFSPEPLRETVSEGGRGCTPIETLDSSESDFPREVDSKADGNDKDAEGGDTLQRDNTANFQDWSDETISLSSSMEKSPVQDKPELPLPLDAVDAPLCNVVTTITPPQVSGVIGGAQNEDNDEEDKLNKTLTPTKEKEVFDGAEDRPFVAVEGLEPPEGDYTSRSGTYRKSKPSLSPVPLIGVSESEQQLEMNLESGPPPMTGDYTKRSGTFRKERSTLPVTTHDINCDTDPGAPMQVTSSLTQDLMLQTEPGANLTEPDLQNSDLLLRDTDELEGHHEASGVKRSATFRKEKPMLDAAPVVQVDNFHDSGANQMDFDPLYSNSSETTQPTMSVPTSSSQHELHPESEDSDSVEETFLLVDSLTVGGVKRSQTFTKEKPSASLFGDDYF